MPTIVLEVPHPKHSIGDKVRIKNTRMVCIVEDAKYHVVVLSSGHAQHPLGWSYYLSDPSGSIGPVDEQDIDKTHSSAEGAS